jgi:hypothetical protein
MIRGKNPSETASINSLFVRLVLPDCSSPKIRIRLLYPHRVSPGISGENSSNDSNDSFMTFRSGKTNKSFKETLSRLRCANFIPVLSRKSLNSFDTSIFELEGVLKLLN